MEEQVNDVELSMEKKLHLRQIELDIEKMNPDQLRAFSYNLYKEMLHREVRFQQLLKADWGL